MLLAFHLQFMNGGNAKLATTTPGSYVEAVRTDYDAKTNQTFMTIVRYNIGSDTKPQFCFMQSVPFAGSRSRQEMVKTIVSDPGIKTIE